MKRILITFQCIVLFSVLCSAQNYKTGIGIRGGTQNGISVKHFVSEKGAIEAIVATRWEGFYAIGLYERIGTYFEVPGFTWAYGAGAHVGFLGGSNSRFDDNEDHTVAGADFLFGLEYKFQGAPISIGLDWKPQYDFIGDTYFVWDDAAFTVRLTFGNKKPSPQE